jgi:hypothetical protein
MRTKRRQQLLIPCILLAVALLISLFFLFLAHREIKELDEALQIVTEQKEATDNLNKALRIQLDSYFLGIPGSNYVEEDYCALLVDNWSESKGTLKLDTFAQVFFTAPTDFTAKLELWRGEAVVATEVVTLNPTEAETVFEANLSTTFDIPTLSADEELQLCLMIEPANGNSFFAYAAGWQLENDNLVIITG